MGPKGAPKGDGSSWLGRPKKWQRASSRIPGERCCGRVLDHKAKKQAASSKKRKAKKGTMPAARLAKSIKVRGAAQHNLKGVHVEIPRDQMTVCCGDERGREKPRWRWTRSMPRDSGRYVRKSQFVRPAVRRSDAEAEVRLDRRAFSGGGDRAETDRQFAPKYGRDRHRDLRLSANPDGPPWRAVLPRLSGSDRDPIGRRDHWQDPFAPQGGRRFS